MTPHSLRLRRGALACGMLAPLLWLAMIALCGALRPGFDHLTQYISELGERGSSTEALMRWGGFVATGLLHVAFAAALPATTRPHIEPGRGMHPILVLAAALIALNGAGRMAAGYFSCAPGCTAPGDPIQEAHGRAATLAFFALIAAILLWGFLFRKAPALRSLVPYSFATACAAVLFLVMMRLGEASRVGTGLFERLASGALSLWIFVTAARLWWLERHETRLGTRENPENRPSGPNRG